MARVHNSKSKITMAPKKKKKKKSDVLKANADLIKVWDPTTKSWYLRQKYDDDQLKIMRGGRYPRA